MIITKLQGGLGNQLFQWAATKALSIKHNTDYAFDFSYFNSNQWNLELNKFKKIILKKHNESISLNIVTDDFYFKKIENNSILDGYWQSEKYFNEINHLIREDLKIENNIKEYIVNKYSVLNENTVSLHVRRGDYVNIQNFHPLQTINYYKNAYDTINENSINVLILSDDVNWCKKNIKFNNASYIENETNIVDLYIMSLCKHNIIANSSFSWWGAWLNKNKNKKIVCPINWFGKETNIYTGDIVPEKWLKV
jgi:hypothetical protein